jgi:hypothetical protein
MKINEFLLISYLLPSVRRPAITAYIARGKCLIDGSSIFLARDATGSECTVSLDLCLSESDCVVARIAFVDSLGTSILIDLRWFRVAFSDYIYFSWRNRFTETSIYE